MVPGPPHSLTFGFDMLMMILVSKNLKFCVTKFVCFSFLVPYLGLPCSETVKEFSYDFFCFIIVFFTFKYFNHLEFFSGVRYNTWSQFFFQMTAQLIYHYLFHTDLKILLLYNNFLCVSGFISVLSLICMVIYVLGPHC